MNATLPSSPPVLPTFAAQPPESPHDSWICDVPPCYRMAAYSIRQGLGEKRRVWVAGGVHPQETPLLATALLRLRRRHPSLLLVLAPRRADEADEAFARLCMKGLRVQRHSQGAGCPANTDVYLLDSLEELPLFYAAGDAAFIGCSLVPAGGHSPLEPLAMGVPAVTGLHMGPFAEVVDHLRRSGGLRQAADTEELVLALEGLLPEGALLGKALAQGAHKRLLRQTEPRSRSMHSF